MKAYPWNLFAIVLLILPLTSYAAVTKRCVTYQGSQIGCAIDITGHISEKDPTELQQVIETFKKDEGDSPHLNIYVNSRGGNLSAAMAMGRLLRRHKATVTVALTYVCFSSCIFLMAGGVDRSIFGGEVGIHTPYDPTATDSDYDRTQRKFDQLKTQAKAYLAEMNIPDSLYDDMLRIPPDQIHVLSDKELRKYGLDQPDPVWQETRDIEGTKYLGITREELYRRRAIGNRKCGKDIPDGIDTGRMVQLMEKQSKCWEAVMLGKKQ